MPFQVSYLSLNNREKTQLFKLNTKKVLYSCHRFFNFGSNRKKPPGGASPQVRRRGSVSSEGAMEGELGGPSYHSYSTGNLKELEDKPKQAVRYYTVEWTVPQLSIMIIYNGTWSILIQ